jgi:hypothetical protein
MRPGTAEAHSTSELTLTELAKSLGPADKPDLWCMVKCECDECSNRKPNRLTGEQLQAARRAAAERFEAIAAKYTPPRLCDPISKIADRAL